MSCVVSELEDGPDCGGKRFVGLNRVHNNVGIISGVALFIVVVIVVTWIIRYRTTNSVTMTHEDPTYPRQNVSDLQSLSSSRRKRLKKKTVRKNSVTTKVRNKQEEWTNWTTTHVETDFDGNCGITRSRQGSPGPDTM
jgi:hypothetical protein